MSKNDNSIPIVSMHSHFNMFRNPHDAKEGPITLGEQIKAVKRFVRWHARQVQVGQEMLTRLVARQEENQVELPESNSSVSIVGLQG